MTIHDDLESKVQRAFAFAPAPGALSQLDQRVARAIAQPAAARRGMFTARTILRPLLVVAAFVLLTGAVAGTLTLLERLAGDSTFGTRTAWERGTVLGIRAEDAGLALTLERAYVDLNQIVVFLEVEGAQAGTAVDVVAQLRDPAGRPAEQWAGSMGGRAAADPDLAAAITSWEGAILPRTGMWELTVTSVGAPDGMTDGLWQFTFELPSPSGTAVVSDAADTSGEATIRLSELRVAPSMVTGRLYLELDGAAVAAWAPTIGSIRRDGEPWSPATNPNYTSRATPDGGQEFSTSAGADEATGTWQIEISRVQTADLTTVEGPWTLTVVVP